MSTNFRITRLALALSVAAGLAACNDIAPPTSKPQTPIAAAPPSPSPLPPPPPVATAPTPATVEQPKPQPTVAKGDDDDDEQEIEPSKALDGARKLLADGNGEGALRFAKVAVLRTPKRSGAWNVLGRAQLILGKRKDAIASFEKAVELNPKSSYARNNLGLALIYDKRYEEAADSLEQAVELEPVEAYMWNNLGMAYEQLDRLDDARDAYDKAVAMESDRAEASLTRLKGVKSVIRTAKADTAPRMEPPSPTDSDTKDGVGDKADEAGKGGPSTVR
ncbi:MAG TPA: tetratricopeptide repeat protein [Polyangia bacterium]|nr:tetratricopeptide repeat protein [Polyangia bacterium]